MVGVGRLGSSILSPPRAQSKTRHQDHHEKGLQDFTSMVYYHQNVIMHFTTTIVMECSKVLSDSTGPFRSVSFPPDYSHMLHKIKFFIRLDLSAFFLMNCKIARRRNQ